MRKIGRVLHITSSGKAVIKAERMPKIGEAVLDEKQRHIGTVFDVFGPTGAPYVEIDVEAKNSQKIVDSDAYVYSPSRHRTKSGMK